MIFSKRTFYWLLGSMFMMEECHWSIWPVRLVKVSIVGHLKKCLTSLTGFFTILDRGYADAVKKIKDAEQEVQSLRRKIDARKEQLQREKSRRSVSLMLPDAKLTGCEAIRMAIVGMQTITGIDAVVYVA